MPGNTYTMEVENIKLIIEVASILVVFLAALTVSLFYVDKNRKLKHIHEELQSQIEIQKQSFDNIYREIHDNIGQTLSLAKLTLHAVESGLSEITNENIKSSRELVSKAIIDLRRLGKTINLQADKEVKLNESTKKIEKHLA